MERISGAALVAWVASRLSLQPAIGLCSSFDWLKRTLSPVPDVSALLGPGAGTDPLNDVVSADPTSHMSSAWPADRLRINDALWGAGYIHPGGEAETLRLAKPLGLSAASSLLLLGAGAGGPACSIAIKFGAWVTGLEIDPDLVAAAEERASHAHLGRRLQTESWNPSDPALRRGFFHHTLALEPLRGAAPEPLLTAVAAALKPSGHLAMVELVAQKSLDLADPMLGTWASIERRPLKFPSEVAITRMLRRLGFDVRIVEDLSDRHMHQAMIGWRRAVRGMEVDRPSAREAAQVVREAELWLLRIRLIRDHKLRLFRWHAIGK
jgi:hypothetical protein